MTDEISPLKIDESEIQITFVRSSGPGGQNVNKVATAAQLRFDVKNSLSLPADFKSRLIKLAGSRITEDGMLIIEAKRYRTQEQNRSDALLRLEALLQKAAQAPKPRRKTHPSATAQAARVEDKKHRGAIKRSRRAKPADWE